MYNVSWPQATQLIQVLVLDHQSFTMLLEKEPHTGSGQRRPELHRVRDDGIEVKELDHLQ